MLDVRRGVPGPTLGNYLLSHLGFFTVAPVLAIVLTDILTPLMVGCTLMLFNLAMRSGSLFLTPVISRLPFRVSTGFGLVLAGCAFVLAPHLAGWALVATLTAAGLGVSINGSAIKLFVATHIPENERRQKMFSGIQIAVNCAAAIGPFVGNLLLDRGAEAVFLVTGLAYFVAALSSILILPARGESAEPARSPLRWHVIREGLSRPYAKRAVLLATLGAALYAQLFSSFPVIAAMATEDPLLRGGLFFLNAAIVVVLQIPVTKGSLALITRGWSPMRVMALGVLVLASSLLVLGISPTAVLVLYLVVFVFSLGEAIYIPSVDTAFLDLSTEVSPLELINLRQISNGVGESLGSFIGASAAAAFIAQSPHLLMVAAVVAAIFPLVLVTGIRTTSEKRVA
ncbi:MFS transporter [Lipingzhangella sp. LS1_29]|uniref:MFS transporter n=1 Tax=Lipingzhangella rawalii TaxID=2055835 RepID=A0ABU2H8I2_9ACTN|nr:MFS transporter [Lipingzhangella rawalii]MDS1271604.1 MFS transporter [Lipingzhangella rawalii]